MVGPHMLSGSVSNFLGIKCLQFMSVQLSAVVPVIFVPVSVIK